MQEKGKELAAWITWDYVTWMFQVLWISQTGLCQEFIGDEEQVLFQESYQWPFTRLPSGPKITNEQQRLLISLKLN